MAVPFSNEEFLGVFLTYNQAIQPVQIIAYVLGILALFWIWTGTVYHIVFFTAVNKAAYLIGVLFIAQGLSLLYVGFKSSFDFQIRPAFSAIAGILFVAYAIGIYPLLNYAFGHAYPVMPVFGITPCPVTIFIFGILLWANERVPWFLIVIPFLWSIVGISAAISLGIIEDYGLVVAGFVGSILILNKGYRKAI